MPSTQPPAPDTGKSKNKPITSAEEAAKLVTRSVVRVTKDKDGNAKTDTVEQPIKADEVAAFKDYGDFVVVVTTDGQKFRGAK